MQKINQYFGGTYETLSTSEHVGKEHLVDIKQEKFSTLFQSKTIKVNSFHHNIITKDTIGDSLIPFAFSENDNTVEGFYHSKLPIIGVMWHPEREQKKFDELIIQQFFEEFNNDKK
jgi:putative glutamine amidotransferase